MHSNRSFILDKRGAFVAGKIGTNLIVILTYASPRLNTHNLSLFYIRRNLPNFDGNPTVHGVNRRTRSAYRLFFSRIQIPTSYLLNRLGTNFRCVDRRLSHRHLTVTLQTTTSGRNVLRRAGRCAQNHGIFNGHIVSCRGGHFILTSTGTHLAVLQMFLSSYTLGLVRNGLSPIVTTVTGLGTARVRKRVLSRLLRLCNNCNCDTRCNVNHT